MKVASKEEVKNYTDALVSGFIKGAAVGTVAGVGLWAVLRKKSAFYNTWTVTTKTFFGLAPPIVFGTTNAEWVSLDFDMNQYKFGHASENATREQEKYQQLSFKDKILYDAQKNKYKVITGLWAASLGGSFWYINRDRLLSKSQKIVQARMYAQALTVGLLLGSMLLSVNSYNNVSDEAEADENSWEAVVAREEARERAAGNPLRIVKKKVEHVE